MNQPMLPRIGAACGAVFAIVLTIANGDGSQPFSSPRAIAGIAALTLAIPFLAYLTSVLHHAEPAGGWLARAALASGIAGITLKLGSSAPELALYRAHLPAGSQLHTVINALGGAATVLSLSPLAVFCAATATVAFRARALPRWLAAGAAVTAAALAANGAFLTTSAVPALLLFALWILLASVHLLRRTWHNRAPVTQAQATAIT